MRDALFQRLAGRVQGASVEEDVLRNLNRILNTRRSQGALRYGLPDFDRFSPERPESQRRIEQLVLEQIQRFEPRLEAVTVSTKAYRNQTLLLEVVATLKPAPRRMQWLLRVRADGLSREEPTQEDTP